MHNSTCISFLVEPVVKMLPQEQTTFAWGKYWGCIFSFILLFSVNADFPPIVSVWFVFYNAVNQSKEGIVFANAHIIARVYACATLSHQNGARFHFLSGIPLHAEALCLTIAPILAFSGALFMCHLPLPLSHAHFSGFLSYR